MIQNYSSSSSCTWSPAHATIYNAIVVCVRELGENVADDVYNYISSYYVNPASSSCTLQVTPTSSAAVDGQVQLTVTPIGWTNPEFEFHVVYSDTNGSHSFELQPYSAATTCTWSPSFAQRYSLCVEAREHGQDVLYNNSEVITDYHVNPAADPLQLSTGENIALPVNLHGEDGSGVTLYNITSSPKHGNCTGTAPSLTYTPNTDFVGNDSLSYTVTDSLGYTSAPATVNIEIFGTPTANAQSQSTIVNTPITLTLSGNDPDTPPLPLSSSIVTGPAHGSLSPISQASQQVTYTPNTGYYGTDSFTFKMNNGYLDSAPATVNITVIGKPIATSQTLSCMGYAAIMLSGSDPNTPALPLTYRIITPPDPNYSLTDIDPDTHEVDYGNERDFDYYGQDSFSFVVNNGYLDSDPATVTIYLPEQLTLSIPQNTSVDIFLADLPDNPLEYAIEAGPWEGTLGLIDPVSHLISYTPDTGFSGFDCFYYAIYNDENSAAWQAVYINVMAPPVVTDQTVITDMDTPVSITLSGVDPNNAALTFYIDSNPQLGILSGTAPNLTYTPNTGINGADSFTYHVVDADGFASIEATVSITVDGPPTAFSLTVSTNQNTPVAIPLIGTDPESEALAYFVDTTIAEPENGTLSGTVPNLTYTPNPWYFGDDCIYFYVVNADGICSTDGVVTIMVNENPPTANSQTVSTNLNAPVSITLTGTDPEGEALTYFVDTTIAGPANGTLSGTAPNLTYTPNPGYFGDDVIDFYVVNADGFTSTDGVVTIKITENPLTANSQMVSTDLNTPVSFTLTGTDSTGEALTYFVDTNFTEPENGTLSGTAPNLTYTPNPDYYGIDVFFFYVVNTDGISSTDGTVTVTVSGNPPTANSQQLTTALNTPVTITLTGTDPASESLTYTLDTMDSGPDNGTLTGTAPNLTYTPNSGFSGEDSFTFSVTNTDGLTSDSAVVSIYVVQPPTVSISARLQNAGFNAGAPFTIMADAAGMDIGDTVTKVDFYAGATMLGESTCSPFAITVTDLAAGNYNLTAVATDANGASTTSTPVTITINAAPASASSHVTVQYQYNYDTFVFGRLASVSTLYNGEQQTPATTFSYFEPSGELQSVNGVLPGSTSGLSDQTVTTSYSYDDQGNLLTITAPGNNATQAHVTTYAYATGIFGEPTSITDDLDHSTQFQYDDRGNVSAVIDAAYNETDYTYNLDNQLASNTIPTTGSGYISAVDTYAYIGGPLIAANKYDDGGDPTLTLTFTYDANGNKIAQTGNFEDYTQSYDALGRVVALTNGAQQTTQYSYDDVGRLLSVTYPDNTTLTNTDFDADDRVVAQVDGNGLITNIDYDPLTGLITDIQHPASPGDNVQYAYDGFNRLAFVTDRTGQRAYCYDDLGMELGVDTTYTGLPTFSIGYSYNPDGSRASMNTSAGNFSYSYDAAGRVVSLTNPFAKTTSWDYQANNWLFHQYLGNQTSTTYAYDTIGRLSSLTDLATDASTLSAYTALSYNGQSKLAGYQADVTAMPALSGLLSYNYDTHGHLQEEQSTLGSGYDHTFNYDPDGNPAQLLGATASVNSTDEFLNGGFSYDDNGNPLLYNSTALTFNVDDQVTQFGTQLTADYTADGLRAWKQQAGGSRTYFYYDGLRPVCEVSVNNGSASVTAVNTFGPTGLLARNVIGGQETWYQFDALGNIAQRLDADGLVLSSDQYDAWGKSQGGGGPPDPFGYHAQDGYYTDAETGLIFCTHRYYDPQIGRWLTRDPIGMAGGINLYAYCGNDPINGSDPTGFCWDSYAHRSEASFRNEYLLDSFRPLVKGAISFLLAAGVSWIPGIGEVADAAEIVELSEAAGETTEAVVEEPLACN